MADRRDAADGEAGQLVRLAGGRPADVGGAGDRGQPGEVDPVVTGDEAEERLEARRSPGTTKTSDLTIWPSSAPTAAAASAAVWVDSSKTGHLEGHALAGGGVEDALDRRDGRGRRARPESSIGRAGGLATARVASPRWTPSSWPTATAATGRELDAAWPGWDAERRPRHRRRRRRPPRGSRSGVPIDLWVGDGDSIGEAGLAALEAARRPARTRPAGQGRIGHRAGGRSRRSAAAPTASSSSARSAGRGSITRSPTSGCWRMPGLDRPRGDHPRRRRADRAGPGARPRRRRRRASRSPGRLGDLVSLLPFGAGRRRRHDGRPARTRWPTSRCRSGRPAACRTSASPAEARGRRPARPAARRRVACYALTHEHAAVGDLAPEVALPDETGTIHRLADQRGRWTILYFYPEDDTPGCTIEACEFRDRNEIDPRARRGRLGHQPAGRRQQARASARSSSCRSRSSPTRTTPVAEAYGVVGREAELRQDLHGHRPLDVPDRPRRPDRPRLAEGQGRGPRRGRPRGARRAPGRRARRDRGRRGLARGGTSEPRPKPAIDRSLHRARRPPPSATTPGGRPGSWSSPPTPTTPTSARPGPPPAGSTPARTGWLVCCTSGDQGGEDPDADPLELAALRETRAARGGRDHRLRRGDLPPPARRRARQRPRPARAARPRDPDLPARRGPRHRPRDDLLPRRRDQPHRPSRGRHRRGRRGLSGGPQPDGLPVARPRRPGGAQGPPALPLLVGRAATPGSTSRRRSSARSTRSRAHASQIHDPDGLAERIRTWAAEEGAPIGSAAAEALRLVVIDDDEDEGPG